MRAWFCLCAVLICSGCGESKREPPAEPAPAAGEVEPVGDVYECPMHCKLPGQEQPYTQGAPGQCPVCGMDLEKEK